MKKIGILAFGGKNTGGIYQYTQSIIDALKEDKTKEYVIFCYIDDNRFDQCGLEIRKIGYKKDSVFKNIVNAFQLLFFIRKPYFFTKKELEVFSDIDLFLSPAISAYPHFYLNKPFVFTLHDMQERYYPEFFSKIELLKRWLNNRALSKSAFRIICESNFVKNDIVNYTGADAKKIKIIQSPPPEEFLNYTFSKKQFQVVKEKYGLPQKYIFYPAQCWFHKNHIKLIEAFEIVSKQNPDIELILTGSQQNNYDNLMNKISELNLQERVRHLGYIDYADLPYFYKMSQFLVMPTLFESVSIPIYEAFSLEVAVCCSNVVALPEQVGDAGLIFDPHDIEDMAQKMLMFLNNENLRKDKARLGFLKVKEFNHSIYKERLIEVFK